VLSIERRDVSGVAEKTVSSRFADNRSDKILARNRLRIIIHNRSPMVADVGPSAEGRRRLSSGFLLDEKGVGGETGKQCFRRPS